MAEFKFQILDIETDLEQQNIIISCSQDIDEDSFIAGDVYVMHKKTNQIVPIEISVDRCDIIVHLMQWAVPNDEYLVMINANIESIVGDRLDSSLLQNIIFNSDILSTVNIESPANFETITGPVTLKWHENLTEENKRFQKDLIKSFYIEMSTDTGFYNIEQKTFTGKKEMVDDLFSITLKEPKEEVQYYVRIRAQEDENSTSYGKWSTVKTFIYSKEEVKENNEDKKDDSNSPIVEPNEGIEPGPEAIPQPPDAIKPPLIEDLTGNRPCFNMDVLGEASYEKYLSPTPKMFKIKFPKAIDISNAKVVIERSDI